MSEWTAVSLASVADITVGFVGTMARHYETTGVPFLRSQNVRAHRIDMDDIKYISPEFDARIGKSRLSPGDVVTVRTGKPGTTAVVPEWLDEANCSDLVITRPGPELDARWLSYYMNSIGNHTISSVLVGAVQQHFNVGAAKSMVLQLPPLPEQQAIAEVLGALDDKIAANTRLATTSDALANSIYDVGIRHWPRKALSEVLTPVLGGTPSRSRNDYWDPATDLWISARDVSSAPSRVVLDTAERISALATATTKAKPLPVGSVILTARGTVGEVARLARPAAFNQSCYGFAPTTVSPEILFYSVLRAAEHARKIAHGSVFDTITKTTFDHLEMAWEPSSASVLSTELSPLHSTIDNALEENRTLAAIRDALLPKLMSGQLRVTDVDRFVDTATATPLETTDKDRS
ncbi:restriction endonuclease subunit S [Microbacterium profundi]